MIAFDNTYVRLPESFYSRTKPTPVESPRLVKLNRAFAELLGLNVALLSSEIGVRILAGNAIPEGADPIALAYAGHQFGSFVPQLGDGRAILLGEVVGKDGMRCDIQLKGSGPTRFSRRGDGRAALGPVLREYIVSEAMAAMGIPTTRALAAVTTGEPVYRENVVPGAVLTRVAASHIRVGTFEYFASREDRAALAKLTRYALERHYPGAVDASNPALALLERVVDTQASLVAKWLGVGFVHGVMNTDNTAISGETIDYGPCAFLDEYDPRKKFSSIDHAGRYAFMSQPQIAQWNLARLAECLLPLLGDDNDEAIRIATDCVNAFPLASSPRSPQCSARSLASPTGAKTISRSRLTSSGGWRRTRSTTRSSSVASATPRRVRRGMSAARRCSETRARSMSGRSVGMRAGRTLRSCGR